MPAALARRLGPDRAAAATLAVGAVAGCAALALVEPGGGYPVCPTRALLGIDCPACGTLRGLHALSRGQLGTALDHNVLLLLAVPIGALVWWRWARTAVRRPAGHVHIPRWAVACLIAVATAFAIARNLPIDPLRWLASEA